jgi:4-amino-4-deoxy-L-arabinose transferase-like glycosyltransferase
MRCFIKASVRNSRGMLLGIFMTALFVRATFILNLQDGFYFPDSIEYSSAALNLITQGELGENYDRPPGYPVFLAAIYFIFGESILTIRLVESMLGAFLAVIIALIGRRVGGDSVGTIAGFLWSIYPLAVFMAGLVYPTGLLTVLLASGAFIFLYETNSRLSTKRVFLAGVLWGLAALTTPVVLATIGVIVLWVICWVREERARVISMLIAGSALMVLPWMVRDFYRYGHFVVIEPRVVEHLPRLRTADDDLQRNKIDVILTHPGHYANRFMEHFLGFWRLYPDRLAMDKPGFREQWHEKDQRVVKETIFRRSNLINVINILSTGPVFIFALIGSAAMWLKGRERRRELLFLWAIILSFAVVYSMFFARTRFRIPIEPYIVILCAFGLAEAWRLLLPHVRRTGKREENRLTDEIILRKIGP